MLVIDMWWKQRKIHAVERFYRHRHVAETMEKILNNVAI